MGDSDRHGAVRQGHAVTPECVIDGVERRPMRVEHVLEGFHQILEEVKPIGDLGGLGRPVAGAVRIGSGPIPRDHLDPRMGSPPLRQGLCLTVRQ